MTNIIYCTLFLFAGVLAGLHIGYHMGYGIGYHLGRHEAVEEMQERIDALEHRFDSEMGDEVEEIWPAFRSSL